MGGGAALLPVNRTHDGATLEAVREGFATGWGQQGRVKSRCLPE